MRTIAEPIDHEAASIKGSRFLAFVRPVTRLEDAFATLDQIKDAHPHARHHTWALRLTHPFTERVSDAGEPSGSAGRPILSALVGRDLTDVFVVVTRYFGGVKLGVGGLVRAYGGTAAAALDLAHVIERVPMSTWRLVHGYEDTRAVEHALTRCCGTQLAVEYGARIERVVSLPADEATTLGLDLRDATAGRVHLRPVESDG